MLYIEMQQCNSDQQASSINMQFGNGKDQNYFGELLTHEDPPLLKVDKP